MEFTIEMARMLNLTITEKQAKLINEDVGIDIDGGFLTSSPTTEGDYMIFYEKDGIYSGVILEDDGSYNLLNNEKVIERSVCFD